MIKSKIKRIDLSKEEPVDIIVGGEKGIEPRKLEASRVNEFSESSFNLASVIFSLQATCNKFGLRYDNILVLAYLKELSVFNFDIFVIDRGIKLTEYNTLNLIVQDFSVKKRKYYRLTERAEEILLFYYKCFEENERFIPANRVLDVSAKASLKNALNDYFG